MALVQLIYVSGLVGEDTTSLGAIVESAVRHNNANGITGMLLYYSGSFLQVLEGEAANVHATYARICADPRHQNVTLLNEDAIQERDFLRWSMGYKQLRAEDLAQFPECTAHFNFGLLPQAIQGSPGLALEMLHLFSKGRFG
jgi:hypothetical protein